MILRNLLLFFQPILSLVHRAKPHQDIHILILLMSKSTQPEPVLEKTTQILCVNHQQVSHLTSFRHMFVTMSFLQHIGVIIPK